MNRSGSKRKSKSRTPNKSKSKRNSKSRSQSKDHGESYLKRPKNAFLLFCQDRREENDKKGGSPLTVQELSKEWEDVSESKKKYYQKMFDEANDEYKEKKKELEEEEGLSKKKKSNTGMTVLLLEITRTFTIPGLS